MTADIARELVALGLPWQSGMASGGWRVLEIVDGMATCVQVGLPRALVVTARARDLSPPDLSDKATLGLAEDWVRGLWLSVPHVHRVEIIHGRTGRSGWISFYDRPSGPHHWSVRTDAHRGWPGVLLAAARAALGGG